MSETFPCACIDHDIDLCFFLCDGSEHTVEDNLFHFYEFWNVNSTWVSPCGNQITMKEQHMMTNLGRKELFTVGI